MILDSKTGDSHIPELHISEQAIYERISFILN